VGVELEPPFEHSLVAYVAPTRDGAVLKVPWAGDDEALHEADALELWGGDAAVRLLRRSDRALLEERPVPGDDLSSLCDDVATTIAVNIALRLWRPATEPFRTVAPVVKRWLDGAGGQSHELAPLARELFSDIGSRADCLVHGDFHHHNIVRSGDRYVAIDPKPYLSTVSTTSHPSSGIPSATS
jgi:streptomycin 6-kinase